jgi:hypothetical protein
MLGLLGVVRPRWPHLPLGRSRQAVLDILCHIFFENLTGKLAGTYRQAC